LGATANERVALDGVAGDTDWLCGVQAAIHRDIQALTALLGNENRHRRNGATSRQHLTEALPPAQSWRLTPAQLADRLLMEDGPGQLRTSGELALIRIQRIIADLLAELGGPAGEASG
jgi:hypothetical protein